MFGDNDYEEWSDFLQEYSPPPYNLPGKSISKSIFKLVVFYIIYFNYNKPTTISKREKYGICFK